LPRRHGAEPPERLKFTPVRRCFQTCQQPGRRQRSIGPRPGGRTNKRSAFFVAAILSLPLAALFAASSLGGIPLPDVYAREAPLWAAQGVGQNWVDLIVAVPLLLISASFTRTETICATPLRTSPN
jgi:hypothetical protein